MISSFSIQDFTHDKMFQNIFATVKFCCRKICHCYCNFYTHSTSSPQPAKDTEKFSRQDHLLHFRAFKPSYTFLWVGRVLPEAKLKKRWTLFFELFDLIDRYWPEIGNPKVWRTDQRTDQPTNLLTWVGARDTCVSKNIARIANAVPVTLYSKFKKQRPSIFEFCFWEDPPHPQKCIWRLKCLKMYMKA